jgi:hypothetical protein
MVTGMRIQSIERCIQSIERCIQSIESIESIERCALGIGFQGLGFGVLAFSKP